MNMNSIVVKAKYGEDTRRFNMEQRDLQFANLVAVVQKVFGISGNLTVRYKDNEGDAITMSSDAELAEAVSISGGILRLAVIGGSQPNGAIPNVTQERPSGYPGFAPPGPWGFRGGHHHGPHHFGKRGWGEGGPRSHKENKLVARHVKDVTIEDGTQLPPNTAFVKTWRIRNEGPVWPVGCALKFLNRHGDQLGGPELMPLPTLEPVQPGQEVDVSVPLMSPAASGRYVGYWKLCTPEGRKFGQDYG